MPERMNKPEWVRDNPISSYVWTKIHGKNKNFLVCFVGSPGSGKSYSAIKFAYDMDRDVNFKSRFDISRVVFRPSDFLNLVNSNLPAGSFIVFDEIGAFGSVNAREWYSRVNKLISYTTQTFRYKNLGVCFTVPALSFVDKQIRLLLHGLVIMKDTSPITKRAYGVWEWMTYSEYSGKVYHPRPRFYENGKKYKVQNISFALPPAELVKQYEAKKREISKGMYLDYSKEMNLIDKTILGKEEKIALTPMEIYKELCNNKDLLRQAMDLKKGRVVADMLRVIYVGENDKPLLDYRTAFGLTGLLNKAIESGKLVIPITKE